MKKIACIAAAVALAGSLGACAQIDGLTAKIDAGLEKNLPRVCVLLASADASFQTVAAVQASIGKPLAHDVLVNEAAAVGAVAAICANPTAVNSTTALPVALNAYAAVVKSLAAAKKAGA